MKLDFRSKSEGARHRQEVSSLSFVSRLYRAGILEKNKAGHSCLMIPKNFTINLLGAGHLNLWDFATLAVLIRKLGLAGTAVEIIWPGSFQGDLSGLQQLLEGLRFKDLFSAEAQGEHSWLNKIRITNYPRRAIQLSLTGQTRFIPLHWLDKHSFDNTGDDLWRATPKLASRLGDRVRSLFLKEGFNDLATIDDINNTFLYELGWNIVLHSEPSCGDGFGVFCAQLSPNSTASDIVRPSIALCVCDCGMGIPRALSANFASALADGSFNPHFTASTASQIVRYSLNPQSTSRPIHASEIDKTGTRGLAHVAATVQDIGSTWLRSDGGAVRLGGSQTGQLDYSYDDELSKLPLLGTQAVVFLKKRQSRAVWQTKVATASPQEFDIHHAVNSDGTFIISSSSVAEDFIKTIGASELAILFDIGFADTKSNQLEYLIVHATKSYPKRDFVFWNVRNLTQLVPFLRKITSPLGEGSGSIAFSGPDGTAVVLGPRSKLSTFNLDNPVLEPIEIESRTSDLTLVEGKWDLEELQRVNRIVNTHLIDTLARRGKNEAGIFTGLIHLPSGKIVSRYFSLLDNTKNSLSGNLTRWVEGCSAAATALVGQSAEANQTWTLLSFAGTTRDLCWQIHQKIQLRNSRAHVLMTYELPTKRDIASLVMKDDNVLLLTDAISTGSLVSEVVSLVTEVGGRLHGIITCVDSRIHHPSEKNRFVHNSVDVPLRCCAELFTAPHSFASKSDGCELWVDPVSLVPQQRNTWEMPKRMLDDVNRSIEFIVASDAAVCGHVVNGTRHSSVYVRVDKLVREAQKALEEQVQNKLIERLQVHGWMNFKPSCIIYPFGTARVEALGNTAQSEASSQTTVLTPARMAADIVRQIWPPDESVEMVEVPRAFDSAGRSQCSKGTLPRYLESIHGRDVLVVDDGMWKGTTANSLLRLAVELGAVRVGIVPFLARFSPEELEYWESISEVHESITNRKVPCCYVFPLFLPIPFTSDTECPYEATFNRIKDKLAAREFAFQIPEHLLDVLRGHNPLSARNRDTISTKTWLQVRCLTEMAVHSEAAMAQLQDILRSEDLAVQNATFELLLEDWGLLGRPRIRQTIAPAVRDKAKNFILAENVPATRKISALSFLRSHHRKDFLDVLPTLSDDFVKNSACLERILLHIATLPEDDLGSLSCLGFFEKIAALNLIRGLKSLPHLSQELESPILQDCYRLWLQCRMRRHPFREGKRRAALQLKAMLETRDFYRSHEAKGFLRVFANGTDLSGSPPETFKSQLEAWQTKHLTFFSDVLLPVVKELRPSLICEASAGFALQPTWAEYLLSEKTTIFRATTDLANVTDSLSKLALGEFGIIAQRTLAGASRRLLQNVIDRDSYLLRLVNGLHVRSIAEFVQDLHAEFDLRLSHLGVTISEQGVELVERNRKLFAPRHMLTSCISHMVVNLEEYAFVPYAADPNSKSIINGEVRIRVEQTSSDNDAPSLVIEVLDNGNSLPQDKTTGRGTTWLDSNMRDIDAKFDGPSECHELPWTVVQRVTILLW